MADVRRRAERRWDRSKIRDFAADHLTPISTRRLTTVLEEVANQHLSRDEFPHTLISRITRMDPMQLLWSPCVSRGELEAYAERMLSGGAETGLARSELVERISTYWTRREPVGSPPDETWSDAAREYSNWERKQKKKKKKKSSQTGTAEDWDADTRGKKGANWSLKPPKHAPKSAAKTKKKKKKPRAQEDAWPTHRAGPRAGPRERLRASPSPRPDWDINQGQGPTGSVRNQFPARQDQPDILFRQIEAPTRTPTPPTRTDADWVTVYVGGKATRVPRNSYSGKKELERRRFEGYAQSTQFRELSTTLHREYSSSNDSLAQAAEPISSDDEEITLSSGQRVIRSTGVNPQDIPTLEELESGQKVTTEETEADSYTKFKENAEQIRKIWIDKLQLQQDQSTNVAATTSEAETRTATGEEKQSDQPVPATIPQRSIDIASLDLSNPRLRPEEPQPAQDIATNLVAQITSEIDAIFKGRDNKKTDRAEGSDFSPLELETTSSEDEAQPKHQ